MILSKKHLDLMESHSNNNVIKYLTLFLTLLGCLSQLYHHTKDYIEKDVLRELNKVPVETFDLPDQTLCFQFAHLVNLPYLRKYKPIILDQVEKFFKINLNEALYYKLINENGTFKEFFVRKIDEHVNFKEFHKILYKKSQIFDRIEVQFADKVGHLELYEIHQHCLIKSVVKTFNMCYTFTCSKTPLNNQFNNRTLIEDENIDEYEIANFTKYTMEQRYLLSYLGKNIVFKIHLNKRLFIKNGLKNFFMQLHEPNTYPRNLASLAHVQEINPEGFRQLYTFTFLHIKRLEKPYKSNCTKREEFRQRRLCESGYSKQIFNSLLFGNYYSSSSEYQNLSLGLNLQYFYYKYNKNKLEKITTDCSIKSSQEQCDEYSYYIFSNVALPCSRMILQLMVPINANYVCIDRPKLSLSEYLLKGLSIVNFWFGFTIIQMLFNLHDDIGILYKKAVKINYKKEMERKELAEKIREKKKLNESVKIDKITDKEESFKIDKIFSKKKSFMKVANGINFINRLFKSKKINDEKRKRLWLNSYLADQLMQQNRAILYKNLKLNNWLYNPLTYSDSKVDDNLIFSKQNNHHQTYLDQENRSKRLKKDETIKQDKESKKNNNDSNDNSDKNGSNSNDNKQLVRFREQKTDDNFDAKESKTKEDHSKSE